MDEFCDFFSPVFFHTLDLTLCIDWDVPGLLVAQVDWSVSKLMHKHD